MNNPTLGPGCKAMIGRADIDVFTESILLVINLLIDFISLSRKNSYNKKAYYR